MGILKFIKSLFGKGFNISWTWRFGNDNKKEQNQKGDRPANIKVVAVRDQQSWKDS
jgi:hypothetical protein